MAGDGVEGGLIGGGAKADQMSRVITGADHAAVPGAADLVLFAEMMHLRDLLRLPDKADRRFVRRRADLQHAGHAQAPEHLAAIAAAWARTARCHGAAVGLDILADTVAVRTAQRLADLHQEPAALARSEEHTSELQSLMRISYSV